MNLNPFARKAVKFYGGGSTQKLIFRNLASGAVAIRYGDKQATVSPKSFISMELKNLSEGGASIEGSYVSGGIVELVRFESREIAETVFTKLFDAYSLRWTRWLRRTFFLFGGVFLITWVLSSHGASSVNGSHVASAATDTSIPPQFMQQLQAAALAQSGQAPNVPQSSLQPPANGLAFNPKLEIPNLPAPALNCADGK